jgi:hypothetical protein
MTGWWFSPGTPVSPTNKTNGQDINKILLKVAFNVAILTLTSIWYLQSFLMLNKILKTHFIMDNYLISSNLVKGETKLGISDHNLLIEKRRHVKQ